MRLSLPERGGLEGRQWTNDDENDTHHKTATWSAWSGEGAAAAEGCAAATWSFQPPGESKEQGTSVGAASPLFGPEYSYYHMI